MTSARYVLFAAALAALITVVIGTAAGLAAGYYPVDALIASPVHPYTQGLLSAVPVLRGIELPAPERVRPKGPLDEHLETPGCLFEPRCPFAEADCRDQPPPLVPLEGAAQTEAHACLHPSRREVVPVPAVPGNAPADPARNQPSAHPRADAQPG